MARIGAADGIGTVCVTPHCFNGTGDITRRDVTHRMARLAGQISNAGIKLRLCLGTEAHLIPGLAKRVEAGEVATINNTGKYLLVELPVHSLPDNTKEEIFQLRLQGVTPIIAHPERNPQLAMLPELIPALIDMGCLMQVTAMSVTGGAGPEVLRFTHRLLRQGMVHLIASDAHSAGDRRPELSTAVAVAGEVMGDPDAARAMVTARPEAILKGLAVEVPGYRVGERGGGRGGFRRW
ncbi:MAG: tyrosine-protein phosphatase, partial [Anaerolineae bacterium]